MDPPYGFQEYLELVDCPPQLVGLTGSERVAIGLTISFKQKISGPFLESSSILWNLYEKNGQGTNSVSNIAP